MSFIDLTVRQTPHTETIHHQLKGNDNTTKQRKLASMARSSKKIEEENQLVRLTRKAREIHTIHIPACTNYIQCVPKRRKKNSGVYKAQWHWGEACSGTYGLGSGKRVDQQYKEPI
jgi:hypothetical protein